MPTIESALAMHTMSLNPEARAWALWEIRRALGDGWDVRLDRRVPSRTGVVSRLIAERAGSERVFFLKEFDVSEDITALQDRFQRVAAVAARLGAVPDLAPFVVTGHDAARRLMLSEEVAGDSILSLHQALSSRWGRGPIDAIKAWHGVGRWLSALHNRTLPPVASSTQVREVQKYTEERLRLWADADPARRRALDAAASSLDTVAAASDGKPVSLVPCHGDISGFNIVVGREVGLIDFDDLRFDMPALDVSQAIMEIRTLSRAARVLPLPRVARQAQDAFVEGYGATLPDGRAFWPQHYRNLAVYGLTIARRRRGISLSRVTDELHYRRVLRELENATATIRRRGADALFFA